MTHFDREMIRLDAEDHFSDRHDPEALGIEPEDMVGDASEPVAFWRHGRPLIIWDDIVFRPAPWWAWRRRRRQARIAARQLAWYEASGLPAKMGGGRMAHDPWAAAMVREEPDPF